MVNVGRNDRRIDAQRRDGIIRSAAARKQTSEALTGSLSLQRAFRTPPTEGRASWGIEQELRPSKQNRAKMWIGAEPLR
jgi:hypothetical protein